MMRRRAFLTGVSAAALTALVGCSDDGDEPESGSTTRPPETTDGSSDPEAGEPSDPATSTPAPDGPVRPRVDSTIASGLNVPWALAFLPGGDALVAERDSARILRVSPGGRTTVLGEVPGVQRRVGAGEGGLLGIELLRSGRRDQVLAYITTSSDNRIVAMDLQDDGLGSPRVLLDGIPMNTNHNGGRLLIGPDDLLYASTGDAYDGTVAQDTDSLGGKILRLTPDGDPAPGNPFDNEVWSYGHRNVQGLAFDADERLWATEFGADAYDELNLIEKGGNYGWPQDEGIVEGTDNLNPKVQWRTEDCSPSGLAITRSTAFVCALRGESLYSVPLDGASAGEPKQHLAGEYGRIRAAALAPDGSLWVTTSNTDGRASPGQDDDRILRITL